MDGFLYLKIHFYTVVSTCFQHLLKNQILISEHITIESIILETYVHRVAVCIESFGIGYCFNRG